MNDVNLLIFGCGVCLIAVAGACIYLRESFLSELKPVEAETHNDSMDIGDLGFHSSLEIHS
jgi:hypothetical protein